MPVVHHSSILTTYKQPLASGHPWRDVILLPPETVLSLDDVYLAVACPTTMSAHGGALTLARPFRPVSALDA
jgi:hypothetical protein